MEARAPTAVPAAAAVIDWIRRRADRVAISSNPAWGWIGGVFVKNGAEIPLVRVHSEGTTAVYFDYTLGKPVFDDLGRRQALLNRVPGIKLPPDAVSKRKTMPLSNLGPDAVGSFLAVLDWFVEELRSGGTRRGSQGTDEPVSLEQAQTMLPARFG